MSVEIIFEFHSTSLDNESGVASGWSDPLLSDGGRALASELGERRQVEQIAAVFCSDLRRAIETAEIAFGARIPIHPDRRLREYDYGTMTGAPVEHIHAERPARVDMPFPEGESLRDVADRIRDFLKDLAREWDGNRILIIGHGATKLAPDYLLGQHVAEGGGVPDVYLGADPAQLPICPRAIIRILRTTGLSSLARVCLAKYDVAAWYNRIVKKGTNRPAGRPSVIIVGAGFGGLRVARGLRGAPVDVTVLDKHNYHTFIPLLYQVATAGLEPEAIAHPVRRIVTAPNVRFRLAEVTGVDLERRRVTTDSGVLTYDFLVLAAGSVTNFFGLESVARHAATLRELDEAETVRDRVLAAFEAAAAQENADRKRALMTTVIVGGGPTGVELAGSLAELHRHVLPRDFPELDVRNAHILLLEASDRLLEAMSERMQRKALQKLREMGVDVQLGARVTDADEGGVTLQDGRRIDAGAVVWVAGMRASPLAQALNIPLSAGGRVAVAPSLNLSERPEVYVIGDMAHATGPESAGYPMLAPVAIQQGDLVAANILRQTEGRKPRPFDYKDPGTMVTIGRASAVARVYGVPVSGLLAWLLWLTVHIVWLIGFRNRALVLVDWAWNYFTYERGVRLIRRRP